MTLQFKDDLIKFYIVFKSDSFEKEMMVETFSKLMIKWNRVYHWDEKAEEIVYLGAGDVRLFDDSECSMLDDIVEELYCDELFNLTYDAE